MPYLFSFSFFYLSAREAPYAKARTHFSRDVQMTLKHGHENARTAAENGPSLLA